MPMYYPDLKSVQNCVMAMRRNKDEKKYNGIYPKIEKELPKARKQLAQYFREVWNDEINALEIELAVDKTNYHQKMRGWLLGEGKTSPRRRVE